MNLVPFYIKPIKRMCKALMSTKLDRMDDSDLAPRPLEHSLNGKTVPKLTSSLNSQRIGDCFCQNFKEEKAQ